MALGAMFMILGMLFFVVIVAVFAGALILTPARSSQKEQRVQQPDLVRQYRWIFPAQPQLAQRFAPAQYSLNLSINQTRYNRYRRHTTRSLSPYRFDRYVMPSAPEVQKLAQKLSQLGQAQNFMAYELLCFTLAFVQQGVGYTHDVSPETGEIVEFPKYPIETLAEQTGDCEDQAILMASLLKNMGFEVALLILPTHVALGLAGFTGLDGVSLVDPVSGEQYYYTETTVHGWLPGQVPLEFMEDINEGVFDILPIGDEAEQ
jgi:transglutaminase-like putative cysteine protease